jgi:hypothetical protein
MTVCRGMEIEGIDCWERAIRYPKMTRSTACVQVNREVGQAGVASVCERGADGDGWDGLLGAGHQVSKDDTQHGLKGKQVQVNREGRCQEGMEIEGIDCWERAIRYPKMTRMTAWAQGER